MLQSAVSCFAGIELNGRKLVKYSEVERQVRCIEVHLPLYVIELFGDIALSTPPPPPLQHNAKYNKVHPHWTSCLHNKQNDYRSGTSCPAMHHWHLLSLHSFCVFKWIRICFGRVLGLLSKLCVFWFLLSYPSVLLISIKSACKTNLSTQ